MKARPRNAILLLLAAFIVEHAPFRLAALAVATAAAPGGVTRVAAGDDRYWDALDLELRLIHTGWTVAYKPHPTMNGEEVYGVTNSGDRTVVIDADLHWNARYSVLAHEFGHTQQPAWLDRAQGEAFAEAVSYLLAGGDVREHARYLRGARPESLLVFLTEWQDIYRAAGAAWF
jgi:hypothetical protein